MQHDLAAVLDVVAVAADQAVHAEIPQFLLHLGAGASGTQEHQVAGRPCSSDGVGRRSGQLAVVVDEGAVDVEEQDAIHVFSVSNQRVA